MKAGLSRARHKICVASPSDWKGIPYVDTPALAFEPAARLLTASVSFGAVSRGAVGAGQTVPWLRQTLSAKICSLFRIDAPAAVFGVSTLAPVDQQF